MAEALSLEASLAKALELQGRVGAAAWRGCGLLGSDWLAAWDVPLPRAGPSILFELFFDDFAMPRAGVSAILRVAGTLVRAHARSSPVAARWRWGIRLGRQRPAAISLCISSASASLFLFYDWGPIVFLEMQVGRSAIVRLRAHASDRA